MATIKKHNIWHGKADNLIFYEFRGQPCIRSKPQDMAPPSSPGQVAQQERVAAVAIFYKSLRDAGLYAFWQKAAEGMVQTGYNLLLQKNIRAFNGDGCICDFSKLQMTPDLLPLPDLLSMRVGEEGEAVVEWSNSTPYPGAKEEDRLAIALMRKDTDVFDLVISDIGICRRRDERAVFRVADNFFLYEHFYIFFIAEDGERCSLGVWFHL